MKLATKSTILPQCAPACCNLKPVFPPKYKNFSSGLLTAWFVAKKSSQFLKELVREACEKSFGTELEQKNFCIEQNRIGKALFIYTNKAYHIHLFIM